MGNRIMKDYNLTDVAFNSLTYFEESLYHRLILSADDYGIFFADPMILSRLLFPLKSDASEEDVRQGLDHLEAVELIRRFTAQGREYLKLSTWEKDQRLRVSRHKYPVPEWLKEDIPYAMELPLSDGTAYGVTQAEADEYAALYPAVDVMQELRSMRAWCLSNPHKQKARSGVQKFINSWLARVQDKGGRASSEYSGL